MVELAKCLLQVQVQVQARPVIRLHLHTRRLPCLSPGGACHCVCVLCAAPFSTSLQERSLRCLSSAPLPLFSPLPLHIDIPLPALACPHCARVLPTAMAEPTTAPSPAAADADKKKFEKPERPNADLFNEQLAKKEKEYQDAFARYVCLPALPIPPP